MQTFISLAMDQAKHSNTMHKHGSVLMCKNQTFTGYNHFSGNSHSGITIHAEEHAITNFITWCKIRQYSDSYIRRKLKRSVLLTIRVKDDCIKHSSPCGMCVKMIQKYEIKHVIYSDQDEIKQSTTIVVKKTRDLPTTEPSSGYRCLERMRINIKNG